jgi:hypothetical protein
LTQLDPYFSRQQGRLHHQNPTTPSRVSKQNRFSLLGVSQDTGTYIWRNSQGFVLISGSWAHYQPAERLKR